jgi:SAM-dependent methyltransferase
MTEDTAPALQAYESLASIYDDFHYRNDYETWLGVVLLPKLLAHGLEAPGAALDVGCGTGRAFPPLLERGWHVCGCDISPAMVEIARERFGDQVRLSVADMCRLPTLDRFDLVLALNDAVNHLLTDRDLDRAMIGFAKNLSPRGLLVFDCNTRGLFGELFAASESRVVERGGRRWIWQGMGEGDPTSPTFSVQISGDSIAPTTITERHFSQPQVERALEAAGLRCRSVLGQREADGKIMLCEHPDEERDAKFVYIASRES